METVKMTDSVKCDVERGRGFDEPLSVHGVYDIEVVGADGVVKHRSTHKNLVTTEGKRYLLDAALDNSAGGYTEKTTWYVALVENDETAVVTQTYDDFFDPGGTTQANEFTSYTAGGLSQRATWAGVLDVGGAASITNSASRAAFAITGGATLYGAALVSNLTFDAHASGDYLFSYSKFTSPITVVNTDTVNVTITIAFS